MAEIYISSERQGLNLGSHFIRVPINLRKLDSIIIRNDDELDLPMSEVHNLCFYNTMDCETAIFVCYNQLQLNILLL